MFSPCAMRSDSHEFMCPLKNHRFTCVACHRFTSQPMTEEAMRKHLSDCPVTMRIAANAATAVPHSPAPVRVGSMCRVWSVVARYSQTGFHVFLLCVSARAVVNTHGCFQHHQRFRHGRPHTVFDCHVRVFGLFGFV